MLNAGEYSTSKDLRMPNDSISSIMLGRNMQIEACKHANVAKNRRLWEESGRKLPPNFGGCEIIRQSRQTLKGLRGKAKIADNVISSATVAPKTWDRAGKGGDCSPGSNTNAVAVYQHPDLKGECRIIGVGTYANSKQMNFKNDSVSSIEFPQNPGVYIEVCVTANFKHCETLRTTELNLGDNSVVRDNSITSMKVIRYPSKSKPSGTITIQRR